MAKHLLWGICHIFNALGFTCRRLRLQQPTKQASTANEASFKSHRNGIQEASRIVSYK
ncbi:MAG: hypothetical protein J1E57_10950 [Prevotella sp.]|nr:hypothetical protein [Prevotella sp.]